MAIDYAKQAYRRGATKAKQARKPFEKQAPQVGRASQHTTERAPLPPRRPLRRNPEVYMTAPRNPLPIAWIVAAILGAVLVITVLGSAYHRHKEKVATTKTQQESTHIATTKPNSNTQTPSKAATGTATKSSGPKFDFYTILPNNGTQKVASNEPATSAQSTTTTTQANQSNTTQTASTADKQYMLDVATYKEIDKAEDLRARLLLMGYHPVVSKTKSGWYRIEIGPYTSLRKGDQQRLELEKRGISGSFVHPITANPQVKQA